LRNEKVVSLKNSQCGIIGYKIKKNGDEK